MISYSQNFEDVLLARVFKEQERGFYIDVGAMDPVDGSVTKYFYDKGWHGINVEPVERFYNELCSQRERDINLNVGLGRENEWLIFCDFECQGISTLDKEFASHFIEQGIQFCERKIEVTTLANVCEKYGEEVIDFLKIDVEGWEGKVLRGGDWSKFRPRILVIEATKPYSHEPLWQNWEPYLISKGYLFVYFDGLNRFYVRSEESELREHFKFPPNVLDEFQPYQLACLQVECELLREKYHSLQAQHSALQSMVYPFDLNRRGILGKIGRALLKKDSG